MYKFAIADLIILIVLLPPVKGSIELKVQLEDLFNVFFGFFFRIADRAGYGKKC